MSTTTERESSSIPRFDAGASAKAAARPSWVFLASALALSVLVWLIPFTLAPDKSADTLVLFRPIGDADYFSMVQSVADLNFGEASVKELARTGVRPFPFVPFVIHGFLQRLAGPSGFLLADILIVFLYAFALRYFLVVVGAGPWPAELLTLLVVSRAASTITDRLSRFLHLPNLSAVVRFWDLRFPRPFVAELFLVCFLIVAVVLAAQPRKTKGVYALFGLALSLLLQSDIYAATVAAVVLAAVCLMAIAAVGVRPMVTRLAAMGLAFALASAPMIYQQLHTSFDVKRRLGLYASSDYRPLLLPGPAFGAALVGLTVAAIFAWRFRFHDPANRRRPALAVATIGIAASLIAGPLSIVLLRQAIQPVHYDQTAARALGYAVLLYVGWILTDIAGLAPIRNLPQTQKLPLAAGIAFLTLIVCFYSARRLLTMEGYSPVAKVFPMVIEPLNRWDYQTDFPALKRVLDSRGQEKDKVLGTFDRMVADWWEYRGGYVYLADTFNSTVGDSVIESRLFEFLHKMGTTPEEFDRLVESRYFTTYVVAHGKYQADYAYVPWPLEEYSADTQRLVREAPLSSRWLTFEIPRSERLRLRKAFDESGSHPGSGNELDAIVFSKDNLRPYVHPERAANLHLVWENRTFEVWEPGAR